MLSPAARGAGRLLQVLRTLKQHPDGLARAGLVAASGVPAGTLTGWLANRRDLFARTADGRWRLTMSGRQAEAQLATRHPEMPNAD